MIIPPFIPHLFILVKINIFLKIVLLKQRVLQNHYDDPYTNLQLYLTLVDTLSLVRFHAQLLHCFLCFACYPLCRRVTYRQLTQPIR